MNGRRKRRRKRTKNQRKTKEVAKIQAVVPNRTEKNINAIGIETGQGQGPEVKKETDTGMKRENIRTYSYFIKM